MQKHIDSASVSMVNHNGGSGTFEASALYMSHPGGGHLPHRRPTVVGAASSQEPPPLSQFAPTPTATDECSATSASGRQPSATTPSKPTNTSKGGTNSNDNSKRSSDNYDEIFSSVPKTANNNAKQNSTSRNKRLSCSGLAEVTCYCCKVRRKSCDCSDDGITGSTKVNGHLSITTPNKIKNGSSSSCTSVSTHPTDEDLDEDGNSSDSFSRNLEREIESLLSGDVGGPGSMGSSFQNACSQGNVENQSKPHTHVDPYNHKTMAEQRRRAPSPTLSVSDGDSLSTPHEKTIQTAPNRRGSEPPKPLMQPPPLSVSPHHWNSKRVGKSSRKDENKVTIIDGDKQNHCAHCIRRRKEESMAVAATYRSSILSPPTAASSGKKRESVSWYAVEDQKNQHQTQNHGRSILSALSSQHGQHERSFGRMSQDAAGGSVLANSTHSLPSGVYLSAGGTLDGNMAPNSAGVGIKTVAPVSCIPPDQMPRNDLSHTASAVTVTPISTPSATVIESQGFQYSTHPQRATQLHPHSGGFVATVPLSYYGGPQQVEDGSSMAMHFSSSGQPSWLSASNNITMPSQQSPYYSPKDRESDLLYIDSTRHQKSQDPSPKYLHSKSPSSNSPGVLPSFMHPPQQQRQPMDIGSVVTNSAGMSSLFGNVASLRADESQRYVMRKPPIQHSNTGSPTSMYQRQQNSSGGTWDSNIPTHGPYSTDNVPIASLAEVLGGNFDPNKGWQAQHHVTGRSHVPAPLQTHLLEAGHIEITQAQQNRYQHQQPMNPHHHYINNPYSVNHPHRVVTPPPATLPILPVDTQFQPYLQPPQNYYSPSHAFTSNNQQQYRRPSHASTLHSSSSPGGDIHGPTPIYQRQSPHSTRSVKSARGNTKPTSKTQSPIGTKKKPEPLPSDIPPAGPPYKTLLVNFIANTVTNDEIESLFSVFGPLEGCRIIKDRKTNRSKGYAFVYFQNADDAGRAKDMLGGNEAEDGLDTAPIITDPSLKSVIDSINSNLPPPPAPGTHVVLPSAGGPGVSLKGKRIKITFSTNPLNQMVAASIVEGKDEINN